MHLQIYIHISISEYISVYICVYVHISIYIYLYQYMYIQFSQKQITHHIHGSNILNDQGFLIKIHGGQIQ